MRTTDQDQRIVMTLDAGGTALKFSAMRGNRLLMPPSTVPWKTDDLNECLATIVTGFENVQKSLPAKPSAISFAFPGPADYPAGIIGNIGNLPAFSGGVALGPMLEEKFKMPVFINNDGDLFAYGEAIAGFLPFVNESLKRAGSPKQFHNLFGVTLGTGFGGGIIRNSEVFIGDNSGAGEVWLLRNKLDPDSNAEEGVSIRAVRRVYAEKAGLAVERAPDPKQIFEIGVGKAKGDRDAAIEAYRQLGEVAGDAIAQALTLVDGLVVIGGGLAGAHPLFLEPLVAAMNADFQRTGYRRMVPRAFNFESDSDRDVFLRGDQREITASGSARRIRCDLLPRTAVGLSRLGTSEAVAVGAYAFAIGKLDPQE